MAQGGQLYGRIYVWFDSLSPTGITRIVRGKGGGSLSFTIDVMANGKLRFVDRNNDKIFSTGQSIATGRWVRIEWHVDFSTGAVELRFYNDVAVSTPTETKMSNAGQQIRASVDSVQFGRSGHQFVSAKFWTDEPALSGAGYPSVS
jgi:hypothetical protein